MATDPHIALPPGDGESMVLTLGLTNTFPDGPAEMKHTERIQCKCRQALPLISTVLTNPLVWMELKWHKALPKQHCKHPETNKTASTLGVCISFTVSFSTVQTSTRHSLSLAYSHLHFTQAFYSFPTPSSQGNLHCVLLPSIRGGWWLPLSESLSWALSASCILAIQPTVWTCVMARVQESATLHPIAREGAHINHHRGCYCRLNLGLCNAGA